VKLISAQPSPYARKVRIALDEKKIPFELVTEVPWASGAAVAGLNPLGKVPTLVLDNGETLFDSRLILEFLELAFPTPPLLPADLGGRIAAKRFEVLADGVCDAIVLIVIERSRAAERRSPEWIERQRMKVEAGIAAIEAAIAGPDSVLAGGFGLADIAVGSMLGYLDLRFPELAWRVRHPACAALADALAARPSFAKTVPQPQIIPDRVA
jgi:glutathione S-transferase